MSSIEVVDDAGFAALLERVEVVAVDVRPPFAFNESHIPGAVNLPAFLLGSSSDGVPDVTAVARHLGAQGIARDVRVVAYDDGASPAAARLLWVLAYMGHPSLALLDGGISHWTRSGRPTEAGSVRREATDYDMGETDDSVLARLDAVRRALDDPAVIILDVRDVSEYEGMQMTALRNGHIPGARHMTWSDNLSVSEAGSALLRPPEELRRQYHELGITPDVTVIVHCQSGSRSSETFVVLKALGYPDAANYSAGWQEWGNLSDTPVDEL